MHYQYGGTVNTEGKKARLSSAALALVVGLAVAFSGSAAMAAIDPIPGVDIVVRKNPGGIPVTATSDKSGRFSVRVAEPGQYTVSTACRQPSACPPYTVSINASGTPLKPSADGAMTYNFTVGDHRPVVLSGQIQSAGDGRKTDRTATPLKGGEGKPGISDQAAGGNLTSQPAGKAAISTSGSNIRH